MRARQIHPRFWISESIASVGFFERLLFQSLWCLADREGMLLNRPGEIRPQAFPHDTSVTRAKVEAGIMALVKAAHIGIVNRLDGQDDQAIFIYKFKKYQWVNKDEAKSKLFHLYFCDDPQKSIWVHTDPRQSSSYVPMFGTSDVPTLTSPPSPKGGAVHEVIEYLNQVTGRGFSLDRGNKEIEGALKRGATVGECKEVIDRCWAKWKDSPDFVGNVNKVVPFRACHFDSYLDEWRAGAAKPVTRTSRVEPQEPDDPPMTAEERAEAAKAIAAMKNLGVWPSYGATTGG